MRFAPLFLLLSLSVFSEPVYTMPEAQKQAILQRLDSLESKLKTVNEKLANSEGLTAQVLEDSQKSKQYLKEARDLLSKSDEKVSNLEDLLTKASTTLNTLEKRLKDFQFWETVKIVVASVVFGALGAAFGHFFL